jgi:hypothetical protein
MRKHMLSVLALLGLLLVMAAAGGPAHAQDDLGPNLLKNPGFEEGHSYQDNIPQITAPNNWRMLWSDRELIFGGEWVTTRPETVVWNRGDAPANEVDLFWKDGIYNVKIFNSWAPLWAGMTQDVSGLETGAKYRFVAPVYVDVIEDYSGGAKVPPEKIDTAKVRLCAGPKGAEWRNETQITCSGWWTGATVSPFYQAWSTFVWDFVATQPEMSVFLDVAVDYPTYQNNGFFIDTLGLYRVNAAPVQAAAVQAAAPAAQAEPAATATPRADGAVVHVVQPGDTLWVIAVTYAQQLGKTPEEALPYLQELNNNPTFLNVGDEIIIIPGGTAAPEATAETAATPEATAEGAAPEATTEGSTPEATAEGATGETPPATDDAAAEETLPEATSETGPAAGSICVAAFDDANADGVRDATEALVPDAAIAIGRGGNTVSTYITDGMSEPYCFELEEADTYQLQVFPPADFAPTTESSWAVAVANGEAYTVSFGLQSAASTAAASDVGTTDAAADAAAETEGAVDADSGLFSNLGLVVLGVAGLLALLAVAGVVLLRRG